MYNPLVGRFGVRWATFQAHFISPVIHLCCPACLTSKKKHTFHLELPQILNDIENLSWEADSLFTVRAKTFSISLPSFPLNSVSNYLLYFYFGGGGIGVKKKSQSDAISQTAFPVTICDSVGRKGGLFDEFIHSSRAMCYPAQYKHLGKEKNLLISNGNVKHLKTLKHSLTNVSSTVNL